MEQRRTRRFKLRLPLAITRTGAERVADGRTNQEYQFHGVLFIAGRGSGTGWSHRIHHHPECGRPACREPAWLHRQGAARGSVWSTTLPRITRGTRWRLPWNATSLSANARSLASSPHFTARKMDRSKACPRGAALRLWRPTAITSRNPSFLSNCTRHGWLGHHQETSSE